MSRGTRQAVRPDSPIITWEIITINLYTNTKNRTPCQSACLTWPNFLEPIFLNGVFKNSDKGIFLSTDRYIL